MALDPLTVFCPNLACPARGRLKEGTITIHSQKERRGKCSVCGKTFAATKRTPFYRLHLADERFTQVVTLLAYGCPRPAMAAAIMNYGWSIRELLSYHVAPSAWQPPKRRGQVSIATKLFGGEVVSMTTFYCRATEAHLYNEITQKTSSPDLLR